MIELDSYYFDVERGLVSDVDRISENGQLFLAEYVILSFIKNPFFRNTQEYKQLREFFIKLMDNCFIKEGLYDRRKGDHLTNKRSMSHDNLSGIFALSYIFETDHRFKIWKYLVRHCGVYNNNGEEWIPMHPANYFIWGYYGGSKFYWLFFPIYIINFLISMNKKPHITSGKILNFVEILPIRREKYIFHVLCQCLFSKLFKQYKDHLMIFKIYFARETKYFPINILINHLKNPGA